MPVTEFRRVTRRNHFRDVDNWLVVHKMHTQSDDRYLACGDIGPDHRFAATRWDGRSPTYRVALDRNVEIGGAANDARSRSRLPLTPRDLEQVRHGETSVSRWRRAEQEPRMACTAYQVLLGHIRQQVAVHWH